MKINRLLSIIVRLLNKERISAKELAAEFEVSIRTIYRDIDSINMAGIPIISYPGYDGGFGIMENYTLDRQLLSLNDMFSIITTLKGINITLENKALDNAIQKICTLVPKDKNHMVNKSPGEFVIDVLPWNYSQKHRKFIKEINNAIQKKQLMEILYRNLKSELSTRTVEPMTLVFKGYGWYLLAFCRLKNDFRFFRVTRMKELQLLDESFERKEYDYSKQADQTNISNNEHIIMHFNKNTRNTVEDNFDDEEIKELDDGSFLVHVFWPIDEWVYSSILGYGEAAEVIEPRELREKIKEKITKMTRIYSLHGAQQKHN